MKTYSDGTKSYEVDDGSKQKQKKKKATSDLSASTATKRVKKQAQNPLRKYKDIL